MMYSFFFFFKQKTAYEMRISDWSSDVCSSDLGFVLGADRAVLEAHLRGRGDPVGLRLFPEDLVPGGEADDRAEQQQHPQRPPEPAGPPLARYFRGGGGGRHDRLPWQVRPPCGTTPAPAHGRRNARCRRRSPSDVLWSG